MTGGLPNPLDADGFHRVPDFDTVNSLFTTVVEPGPSLSTNPLVNAQQFPQLVPGLRSGLQAAVGSSHLGVVSNVSPGLRQITENVGACLYWCHTNQGQVYCCEDDRQNPHVPIPKPGKCPDTYNSAGLQTCRIDVECPGADKCCIDPNSVQQRACVAPIPLEKLKQ
ncbi:unnamed protein product [Meganyctiphanes norvegica]|uniref:WAP domain-containing protein n=1 Tax=Meganyctiphanes norvegica TaxID=48144 RepID=A0AAV2PXS3_MEGNR